MNRITERTDTFNVNVKRWKASGRSRLKPMFMDKTINNIPYTSMVLTIYVVCWDMNSFDVTLKDIDIIEYTSSKDLSKLCSQTTNILKYDHTYFKLPHIYSQRMLYAGYRQTCCSVNRVLTLRKPRYLAERQVSRGEVFQRVLAMMTSFTFQKWSSKWEERGSLTIARRFTMTSHFN